MTTTSTNLKHLKRGIELSSLPKTIRDAVLVARLAGVHYLWVDALCIIQDSRMDWARESARMGEIFEGAFFVISADSAVDSHSGFLSRRAGVLGRKSALEFKCTDDSGDATSIYMRRQGIRALGAVAHSRAGMPSRLSTRGWAFQERFRASRTLIFAADEMAWECRSLAKCECSFKSIGSTTAYYQENWRHTVETYSALQLTKEDDRLPAFTGIASAYATSNPDLGEYIAGLWRTSFVQQLLWYVKQPSLKQVESRRHASYQAPSWSWASITGPVLYHHQAVDDLDKGTFMVHTVEWQQATINPYGPVSSAHIFASFPYCPVHLIKSKMTADELYLLLLSDEVPVESFWAARDVCELEGFIPDVIYGQTFEVDTSEIHFFAPVVFNDGCFAALILRKVKGNGKNPEFLERVGFCCSSFMIDESGMGMESGVRLEDVRAFLRRHLRMTKATIL